MGDDEPAPELTDLQKEYRKKRMANPAIYANPIWDKEWDLSGLNEELTEEELFKFKEVYSMADIEHIGYLGRRQFTDLLSILNIDVDDDTLEKMFMQMDENGDGQIEFDGAYNWPEFSLPLHSIQGLTPPAMPPRIPRLYGE